MRISSMLGATMVAGAPEPTPAAAPTTRRRPESRRTGPHQAHRHNERRSRRPDYLRLRRRLLQR